MSGITFESKTYKQKGFLELCGAGEIANQARALGAGEVAHQARALVYKQEHLS